MDIHTVATTTHIQARWVLWALDNSAWSSRQRNPVVSYWGKRVKIQGENISSIVGNPIKCLGKWINESLTGKESIEDTKKKLLAWLKTVDGSGMDYLESTRHGSTSKGSYQDLCGCSLYTGICNCKHYLERKVSRYLRRWLGVPPSFTSIGLYSNSIQLSLPVSSVVEDFKVAKCCLVMTLRDSTDNKIAGAGIQTRTGRKWLVKTSVDQAERMLHLRDIIGNTNTGRQGVGMSHFQQWSNASAAERRTMVKADRSEPHRGRSKESKVNRGREWSGIYQSESLHRQNYRWRTSFESLPCWGQCMTHSHLL